MSLRFRKSLKIAPGIKLNLSKSGGSFSIGRKGCTLNVGPKKFVLRWAYLTQELVIPAPIPMRRRISMILSLKILLRIAQTSL